jgi:hypothetical protein
MRLDRVVVLADHLLDLSGLSGNPEPAATVDVLRPLSLATSMIASSESSFVVSGVSSPVLP